MSRGMTIALLAALAGCAGVRKSAQDDASGRWIGEIDRGGQRQAVLLDLQRDGGSYRGELRPIGEGAKPAGEELQGRGGDVSFESGDLRFVGHLEGGRLSGTVTDKRAAAAVGELSAIPAGDSARYPSGSEWSPPSDSF